MNHPMKEKKLNIRFGLILLIFFLVALLTGIFMFYRDFFPERRISPVSGSIHFGTDSSIVPLAGRLSEMFMAYYTDVEVSVIGQPSDMLVPLCVSGEIQAVLLHGDLLPAESEHVEKQVREFHREYVARDAVVVLINESAQKKMFTLDELRDMFSGRSRSGFTPCIDGRDIRFQHLVIDLLGIDSDVLTALPIEGKQAVIDTVNADNSMVALMQLSSAAAFVQHSHESSGPVIGRLVLDGSDGKEIYPDQQALYTEDYPLVFPLVYFYRRSHQPSTGFGAWLTGRGQKVFMRSVIAPAHRPDRKIQLVD
jgi:phosphate transport system substrate-binding protein